MSCQSEILPSSMTKYCKLVSKAYSDKSACLNYNPFLFSNDPIEPMIHGIDYSRFAATPAMVIGISVMRSVEITALIEAQKVGDASTSLVIIDNSNEVHQLWAALKTIFKNKTQKDFLIDMKRFFDDYGTRNLYRGSADENLTNFEELFKAYGYENIRLIIRKTVLIKQTWSNVNLFQSLRYIANSCGADIYAYPSNIVPLLYEQPLEQEKVMTGIEVLRPRLLISTDMIGGRPQNVYTFTCLCT